MTEHEAYKKIKPLLEGYTEGLFWDFKKTLSDTGEIIKDILAFSNSNYENDSYIIVGVNEPTGNKATKKILLTTEDRIRLNTDANYIYLPGKWNVNGLSAKDLECMNKFSEKLTQKLSSSMLISQPLCEYLPVSIGKTLWLYLIIIKHVPGVFISNQDIPKNQNPNKLSVKQGVLYVRIADTTALGAVSKVASATENIRVWKKYIDNLSINNIVNEGENRNE